MVNKERAFQPDYAIPPGETLSELLETLNMPQHELAVRMGRPIKTINEIIKGKTAITPDTALELETVLGVPASFWVNLENNYRIALARKKENEELLGQVEWASKFPLKKMAEYGWVENCASKLEKARELLRFFGIANINAWQNNQTRIEAMYRKSERFECDLNSLAAWLRKGEIDARSVYCAPYSEQNFYSAIKKAKNLTLNEPAEYIPALRKLCADAGVTFVLVRELPGCPVSGAARWLASNKPVIQLSLRYKTNDHFWFTFFHEAGHILKHKKRAIYIDGESFNGGDEEEANRFAQDFLIPSVEYEKWTKRFSEQPITEQKIINFAEQAGIHPGVVVGRLQHDRHISYSQFNYLKQKVTWEMFA